MQNTHDADKLAGEVEEREREWERQWEIESEEEDNLIHMSNLAEQNC